MICSRKVMRDAKRKAKGMSDRMPERMSDITLDNMMPEDRLDRM